MSISDRTPNLESLETIWRRQKENIKQRTGIPDFPFGINEIDRITHGLPKGKVTVIAARTSVGKSAFALQAAVNMSDKGSTVAYISLEDDSEQIAERIYSNITMTDNQELLKGTVPSKKLDDASILKLFGSLKLLPVQDFGYNFEEIEHIIKMVDPKPEIVILDYVQMIDKEGRETEYEALSRFSQNCKKFAQINNIGFCVVSQINRSGAKEGRPMAHHLQGCGRLEQVCDLLLILHCPSKSNDSSYDYNRETNSGMEDCPEDYFECTIAKNKNGINNWVVPMRYTGKFYKFEKWTYRMDAHV